MSKKIYKVGIVSCSNMAQRHMDAVRDHLQAELYMVCDKDKKQLDAVAEKYGVKHKCTDWHDMVADPKVEIIIVVTPDQLHREITVAALEAGKHVLCEKPMALTLDDCRAMCTAAKNAKGKLMVGQICHYAPAFIKAKHLIDKGEIGELFYVESEYAHDYALREGADAWRKDPLRHGFLGGGCHAVDLLRWIAGNPTECMAYANHKMLTEWPTDDCTVAIMKFPKGVIGKVFVAIGCKRDYTMRSVFYGSKGTIICDNTTPHITVFKTSMGGDDTLMDETKPENRQLYPLQMPVAVAGHNTFGEFRDFLKHIIEDTPVTMTAYEGACTVSAALAAVEAAKRNRPVKPDYNFDK